MYLRRNRVRCGDTRRTYLSIAHNVWWSGDGTRKAQSRPIVVASFGVEDNVDIELAREVVGAVERCAPKFSSRRGEGKAVTPAPFPRITFDDAMLKYGSDKPDLRNPLLIVDVTESFRGSGFGLFAKSIETGAVVRAIKAPGAGPKPRSFFDKLNEWARSEGAGGV